MGNDLGAGCDDDAVPTLNDLARSHTSLGEADVEWLHSLVSDWQLLADLSFADLVLWAPAKDGTGWLAIAQMRPTTGPTALHDDVVGTCRRAAGPAGARRGLGRAAHLPGGRPGLGERRPGARGGDPGDAGRTG